MLKSFFLLSFIILFSESVFAGHNIGAKMRQYHLSCGYYTKTTAEIEFNLKTISGDDEGQWVLYYAWEAEDGEALSWNKDIMLGNNSHNLSFFLKKDIIERGRSEYFKKIHFFFKKMKEEEVLEVFPESIPINHFVISTKLEYSTNCLRSVDELPPLLPVKIFELE